MQFCSLPPAFSNPIAAGLTPTQPRPSRDRPPGAAWSRPPRASRAIDWAAKGTHRPTYAQPQAVHHGQTFHPHFSHFAVTPRPYALPHR